MKKALLLIIAAALLLSCSSPEKKAQKLIKSYLKENLNDTKSYDPSNFSKLDSCFSKLEDNTEYDIYMMKYKVFLKSQQDIMYEIKMKESMPYTYSDYYSSGEFKIDMEFNKKWIDSMQFYSDKLDIMENNFKPEFIGWEMNHKYRAKNAMGAVMLETTKFYFDKKITYTTNNLLYLINHQ